MIKIKVGLIDSDKIYSKRFTKLMSERHGSQIEIFSFTDPEKAFFWREIYHSVIPE